MERLIPSRRMRARLLLLFVLLLGLTGFFAWKTQASPAKVIGAAFCHQLPWRSPSAPGETFPLCFRCSGLFLGFMLTLPLFFHRPASWHMPKRYEIILLCASLLFFLVDSFNSFSFFDLHLYQEKESIRFFSGFFLGLTLGSMLILGFNYAFYTKAVMNDHFPNAKFFYPLSIAAAVLIAALLQKRILLFQQILAYPLILTAIFFVSLLYSILFLALNRFHKKFSCLKEGVNLLLLSFCCALFQILLLSFIHFEFLRQLNLLDVL